AMAATCERPIGEQPRCTPSCYTMEPADSRGGKSLERGVAVIEHVVCERAGATDAARYVVADEFAAGKLSVRAHRGRIPKAGKRGSWQADVEAAAATALAPEITRGDVVRVRGGWKSLAHPLTRDKQRCVKVAHYARSLAKPLDACGS